MMQGPQSAPMAMSDDDEQRPQQPGTVIALRPRSLERQRQRQQHEAAALARAAGGRSPLAALVRLACCCCAAAAAAAAAYAARHRRRHQHHHQQQQHSSKTTAKKSTTTRNNKAAAAAAAAAPRRPAPRRLAPRRRPPPSDPNILPEHAAAIPPAALRPLCTLLETVYTLRGWRGGGYHYERAWERALEAAATPAGGGWSDCFDARRPGVVTPRTLRLLAGCLDAAFFGGALHGRVMRRLWEEEDEEGGQGGGSSSSSSSKARGRAAVRAAAAVLAAKERGEEDEDEDEDEEAPPVPRRRNARPWRHTRELDYSADPLDWPRGGYVAAYDSDRHAVRVSRRSWAEKRQVVTPLTPLNCEGWRVETPLAALAHSLAHELVHALVGACFPGMERTEASYLGPDGERHGPAFAMLNRALFGHTSDALEHAAPSSRHYL